LPFVAAVDAVTGAEMLDVSTGVSSSIRASYSSRSIVVLREIGGGCDCGGPSGRRVGAGLRTLPDGAVGMVDVAGKGIVPPLRAAK
jgi:hypothetical protein